MCVGKSVRVCCALFWRSFVQFVSCLRLRYETWSITPQIGINQGLAHLEWHSKIFPWWRITACDTI